MERALLMAIFCGFKNVAVFSHAPVPARLARLRIGPGGVLPARRRGGLGFWPKRGVNAAIATATFKTATKDGYIFLCSGRTYQTVTFYEAKCSTFGMFSGPKNVTVF